MICFPKKVYEMLLPYCDQVLVTKIYQDFQADRFFKNLDESLDFRREALSEVMEEKGIRYQFFKYERKPWTMEKPSMMIY